MTNIIPVDRSLPANPSAADTLDWYRLGDAVEKHGRHMKRQAVAAEYNSGRNMEAWYREIGLPAETGRQLVKECRQVELIGAIAPSPVSQALPSRDAAREYAKAEPEVREVIKEIIKEDSNAEIKAAEIKRLRADLAKVQGERDDAIRHINHLEVDKVQTMVNDLGLRTSINGLLGDLGSGLADEYLQKVDQATKEQLLNRMTELSRLLDCVVERNQLIHVIPEIINV
jgi:hypothetical protein